MTSTDIDEHGNGVGAMATDQGRSSGLGLDVGSSTSTAVAVDGPGHVGDAVTVVRSTALSVTPDREPALAAPGVVDTTALTGFAGRVGDPVALVTEDGRSYTGDELYATTLDCLVREARTAGAEDDAAIVVTYPTSWPEYTVDRLRNAAARHGLTDVTFVPDALAATAWMQQSPDAVADGVVLVADLGASALTVSVVRTGADSAILGRGARSEDVSGAHIDQVVLAYVLDNVDSSSLDPFDPATVEALTTLRAHCATAKEALSSDTETVVPVHLPGIDTDVRLVRSEIEELLRETFDDVTRVLGEALRTAGVDGDAVDRVLLVGGGASIPMLTETVSSALRKPVTVGEQPAATAATGAALLAADIASAGAELNRPGAAALAGVGSTLDDDETDLLPPVTERPASARTSTPAPVSRSAHAKEAPSRGKRTAVIGGVAAAVILLAAGGLSVGTGLVGGSSENTGPSTSSAVAPAAADGSVSATPTTAVAGVDPVTGQPRTTGSAGAPTSGAAAPGAATPGATSPGTTGSAAVPGATAPNAAVPNVQGPQFTAPSVPSAQVPQAPALPAPSLPSNPLPGSGIVGGVTDGLGNVVGGAVGGLGNATGGVVNGLGNTVGGLTSGLTGK
ncbi:Hsp70 family protein [Rhodococcus sp. BP-349]|uniref:Hsp70 family protein n=2 Tax=unclassified Rhodococcus (in: high G+C Gram-positive bacteria) TaxID=192944 RepID=UPI001C9B2223|nr:MULTISPECIES: Hsp70 family protein [unclassified Rhodococcus (in: high G+C Gram-positive bacteria)]MBY6594406.1 Hsp70 family protein [Rhodococcus sp. BP-359]MBY6620432.1 Hsp70 family protein [Rhodococcus sp. BP-357]MBY6537564.1 Hsp70 family protein [Rhodococcus sp. BP-363]MBY6541901.1 Hsp70 family protein [Rhodococcus sp. BP-369]MBY6561131.1 Hsp70 family protein [Rhodococcus sp. BP-370]